jgi:hypothetical protein
MTATEVGSSNRATERAAALRSRSSAMAMDSAVGTMSNAISMTPESNRSVTCQPAWCLGHEPVDAVGPRCGGEVLEQHRAEAPALLVVVDHERHLGHRPAAVVDRMRQLLVAGHGDDLVVEHGHHGEAVDVVERGEVLELAIAQLVLRREEPEVDGFGRQPFEERPVRRRVGRGDGSDAHHAAVGQRHHVVPLRRVTGGGLGVQVGFGRGGRSVGLGGRVVRHGRGLHLVDGGNARTCAPYRCR